MRALIIGAGAVGQVYGHHLAQGGAAVSVYVREKYAAAARRGFDLFQIQSKTSRPKVTFAPREVLTTPEEVGARRFDQVWLAVPTPALESLVPVISKIGDATLVSLQPGISVAKRLAEIASPERTVIGMIGMQSYNAPLEGSNDPNEQATGPGVAFFYPPLVENQFSGLEHLVRPVVDALRMGRAPARVIPDAHIALAFSSAMLMPTIAGLEMAGWDFDAYRSGELARLSAKGAREAMAIVARETGHSKPAAASLLTGSLVRLALGVAKWMAPFDVEAFLRYHFEKVGDQTRAMITEYQRIARRPNEALSSGDTPRPEGEELSHEALDALAQGLGLPPM